MTHHRGPRPDGRPRRARGAGAAASAPAHLGTPRVVSTRAGEGPGGTRVEVDPRPPALARRAPAGPPLLPLAPPLLLLLPTVQRTPLPPRQWLRRRRGRHSGRRGGTRLH